MSSKCWQILPQPSTMHILQCYDSATLLRDYHTDIFSLCIIAETLPLGTQSQQITHIKINVSEERK